MHPLPIEAQLSPVFGILPTDFNNDGKTDLFLCGNFYGFKPQTGRMDASYGTTLLQNGQHEFVFMPPSLSGLFIKGEARDVLQIKTAKGDTVIVVAINNAPLKVFRKR